jgi:hypothetical protein
MNVASRRALVALALLVPAPTLGVAVAMWWWPGPWGRGVYFAAKVWIVALPLIWHLVVEGRRPSWSPIQRGGLGTGAALGVLSAAAIVAAYVLLRHSIDPAAVHTKILEMGLETPTRFIAASAGWILVNSLVEEVVWRWFVTSRWQQLVATPAAIGLSALCFTLHHVVALAAYLPFALVLLASTGVFLAGAMWSWLWARTGSIWPAWIAHVAADAAIFTVGYLLVFG